MFDINYVKRAQYIAKFKYSNMFLFKHVLSYIWLMPLKKGVMFNEDA